MNITFSKHAEFRLRKRGIQKEEVLISIKYPDNTLKKRDKYYFQKKLQRGKIEVVCEKTENNIKVITIYWL